MIIPDYDLKLKSFLKLRSDGWSINKCKRLSSISHTQHWYMMENNQKYRNEVLKYIFQKMPNHFKYKVWLEKYFLDHKEMSDKVDLCQTTNIDV